MKLLFAHDHKFRKIEGVLYSNGGLSDKILERYTKYVDEMVILARIIDTSEDVSKLSRINNPKVKIMDAYHDNTLIQQLVQQSDRIIVRLPSKIGSETFFLAQKFHKKCLVELVACPWDSYWNHSLRGKLVAPVMTAVTKYIVKKSKETLYVTNDFLQKRYPTQGNAFACSDVELHLENRAFLNSRLEELGKKNEKVLVLGTVASIDVKYKGQQFVIKALGKMKREGISNFMYYIAGAGSQTYLRKIAKKENVEDQVVFCGSIPHEAIMEWYKSIDIYIQPSLQEGLPRALIEAMGCGCPAIGSTAGGIYELLDGKNLFKKGNVDDLCKVIKQITLKQMKEEMIKNYITAEMYSVDQLVDKRERYYSKFLS